MLCSTRVLKHRFKDQFEKNWAPTMVNFGIGYKLKCYSTKRQYHKKKKKTVSFSNRQIAE